MFACDQAGDICSWSNATLCLLVSKLDMFARDQTQLHVTNDPRIVYDWVDIPPRDKKDLIGNGKGMRVNWWEFQPKDAFQS